MTALPPRYVVAAMPALAAAYAAMEYRRICRVPRLPEAARDLDWLAGARHPGAPAQLVVVGDSVASGVGASAPGTSFPAELARLAADELGRPVRVRSLGRTQARIGHVLAEQLPLLEGLGAVDAVVSTAGGNDVTHLTPPWQLREQLRELTRRAHTATGAPLLLCGTPEFRAAKAIGAPLRTVAWLNGQYGHSLQQEIAAEVEGVHFVDVVGAVGAEFLADPTLLAEDGYHPNDRGAARLASAVCPALVALLADR